MKSVWILLSLMVTGLSSAQAGECPETLDFTLRPLASTGAPVRLCDVYAGKVLLLVNTASKCAYTPQYEGLEALSRRYADAHPLYKLLALRGGGEPGWNFHKYLLGRDGRVVAAFPSAVVPDDARLLEAIEFQLAQPRYLQ